MFEEDRKDSISTKWREFASNTTVHGLRYVYESPSRIVRTVWLILLLTSIASNLFYSIQSFNKFFSNPVHIEYAEIIPESGNLTFPAVTICNLNRFVKRKINMAENEEDFYKLGLNLYVCEAIKKVSENMTCGQALLCAYEKYGWAVIDNCNATKHRIVNVLNSTKEPIFNPERFLEAYGHDFNEMFLYYCVFSTKEDCKSSDFYPTLARGNRCFTFNSGKNGTKIRNTSLAGSSGGLGVLLDVQMNENTISEFSRGLKLVVHSQGTYLNLERGFNVFPGTHTVVGVTTIHVRLYVFICFLFFYYYIAPLFLAFRLQYLCSSKQNFDLTLYVKMFSTFAHTPQNNFR